jgi:L-fuconolactonase
MTAGHTSDQSVGTLVVDAHHHLWDPDHGYTWLDAPEFASIRRPFSAGDLRAELSAHGVNITVLVEGGRCHPDEVPEHLAIAAATPEIAGVVAWADIAGPDVASAIAGYRQLPGADKLVGIRDQVQGRLEPDFLNRPEVRAGIAAVGAAGLAFDLVVRVDQLGSAAATAAALPEVRLVLDHLGKPRIAAGAEGLSEWCDAVAPLAACPNVTCKLSGMVTEASVPAGSRPAGQRPDTDPATGWTQWTVADLRPFTVTAVELFGTDRVMFGSDWPVCTTVASYGEVLAALREALPDLSDAETEAVFGGNAIRTYRLEAWRT